MTYFAHTADDGRPWEPLGEHLALVAGLAGEFAAAWNAQEWAALAGLWHDLGKLSEEFQAYLRQAQNAATLEDQPASKGGRKVDHSTAGARVAVGQLSGGLGLLLAYPIAGHHGGLPDWDAEFGESDLKHRLDPAKRTIPSVAGKIPPEWLKVDVRALLAALPFKPATSKKEDADQAFRLAFWVRMLFSALVDADFLATESFMNLTQARDREKTNPTMDQMEAILTAKLKEKSAGAADTPVNQTRRQILAACLKSAEKAPGFFSLTVPTGGGKTLSGLAFALRHARMHGLRRVVMAVPFTSIIEQNAQVYQDVFAELGADAVLEHHSNLDPEKETVQSRLASENWDASLVVTTNVQLFESLFANRTGACRKLHRLAKSVIVLDEAQTIPVELLAPCLAALRELVETYGCTVVLCSATQPAVNAREGFPIGLPDVREIMPKELDLHGQLRRTAIQWVGKQTDDEVTAGLMTQKQVLCVVNSRPHAAALFGKIHEESPKGAFHLSTRMCAQHRTDTLTKIRQRLKDGKTCRVVSTQLIEAGVDVDFPMVFRALAGLDSITQAAGRCNREGKLVVGEVRVFDPEAKIPMGHLRQTADTTRELLGLYGKDLASPEAVKAFFEMHYWKKSDAWDRKKVMECFRMTGAQLLFQFKECAKRFRIIEEAGTSILIPYGDGGREMQKYLLDGGLPDRFMYRRMQRLTVQVRPHELERLQGMGAVSSTFSEIIVLTGPQSYDPSLGLRLDGTPAFAAQDLIV